MGLLFTGRHSIRAWEYALFEGKNEYLSIPDVKLYAKLTEQQIANDCRIILDSAEICTMTSNRDILVSRMEVAKERYKHLKTLVPFADSKQKPLIKQADKAMKMLEHLK